MSSDDDQMTTGRDDMRCDVHNETDYSITNTLNQLAVTSKQGKLNTQ